MGGATISSVQSFFRGSRVAITGAAGSVGSELVAQLLGMQVASVVALDNDENGLFGLTQAYRSDPRLIAQYCDVSRATSVETVFAGIDFVFHAAALKQVPICETRPSAAVDVNVVGVNNVIEAALRSGVKRLLFTSSDKAVNPTSVMGASKLVGERIATAGNMRNGRTVIACTRFGNVAGTRGSVIPLFLEQIARGGPLTLTSPEMTRFFMTLESSCQLVLESMIHARGGEIFVTKMLTIGIADLATSIVRIAAPALGRDAASIKVNVIGPRMGEKLYEELTTDEEKTRCFDAGRYLVVQPVHLRYAAGAELHYEHLGRITRVDRVYNSNLERVLSADEIDAFLIDNGLVPSVAATNELKDAARRMQPAVSYLKVASA